MATHNSSNVFELLQRTIPLTIRQQKNTSSKGQSALKNWY
ncbi:hypothetical protein Nizo2726_2869 [Lactiplantibacillus plantarum]|nr:hypothetical protein I526_1484 [Lactiplantibacillus plantarum DOMLa]ASL79878.1 hypothetical protein GBLP1_g1394 [Lactiplantibacillus plantarum]KZT86645.1 hypothetical protein Nizo2029_1910 [Lactiplantibacillus plantarum]KZU30828.1 hypothetical protein Nizo2726_2869 [Lactiplantibacillus plantarum]KZU63246.1 hypothetical protein Nizo2830_2401 [Lactiplantibacillus plantarum]